MRETSRANDDVMMKMDSLWKLLMHEYVCIMKDVLQQNLTNSTNSLWPSWEIILEGRDRAERQKANIFILSQGKTWIEMFISEVFQLLSKLIQLYRGIIKYSRCID